MAVRKLGKAMGLKSLQIAHQSHRNAILPMLAGYGLFYEYRTKIAMDRSKVDGFVLGATYKPTDTDLQNFLRF